MPKKPYSLWKRRLPSGNFVYYARFRLSDGRFGVPKSSGESKKTAAEAWAISYLSSGQIVQRERTTFDDFTKDFFAWDGTYITSLLRRGHQIGKTHAANQQRNLDNHLRPVFGTKYLTQIDTDMIGNFTQALLEQGLAANTINGILIVLGITLEQAYRKKLIQAVPIIDKVVGKKTERNILSLEEAQAFFGQPWRDNRYYTINYLSATTGMRLGEIKGLQRKVIHDGYIDVIASWERGVGLKDTKTGEKRRVPLTASAQSALKEILDLSPYREPDDFIFYGREREAPGLPLIQ
jgi:integrase